MAEPQNLANAIVIIGAIYFLFSQDFGWLIKVGLNALVIFGIATWAHLNQSADEKKLVKLGIKQTEANIQNLNAATAIAIANTKLILRKMQ